MPLSRLWVTAAAMNSANDAFVIPGSAYITLPTASAIAAPIRVRFTNFESWIARPSRGHVMRNRA